MSLWSEKVYNPGWAEGGGWMGDLGGGQQDQTSSSQLDPEMQKFRGEAFDFFRNKILNSEYTPYTGERFAPNNQNLNNYFSGAGYFGTAGAPSGIQGANSFQGTYGSPTTYRSTYQAPDIRSTFQAPDLSYMSASDYRTRTDARMNPYEDQVVQQAMSDIDREQAQAQNQAGADVAKAKAFGSRGELYQAETNRQFADAKARTAANLRQQGYRDALSSVDAEQARTQQLGLQSAGMAADDAARAQGMRLDSNKFAAGQDLAASGLTEQSRGMSANDAARAAGIRLSGGQALTNDQLTRLNALGGAGGVEQGLTQQQNDFDYSQWQEGQNFDLNKLNGYISLLSGTPYGQTSTTSMYSNPLSGLSGSALTAAGIYGLLNQ